MARESKDLWLRAFNLCQYMPQIRASQFLPFPDLRAEARYRENMVDKDVVEVAQGLAVKAHPSYVSLSIRVTPRSRRTGILGIHGNQLKIGVKSAPEGGQANSEAIALIAELLGLPKRSVSIQTGQSSRQKSVRIEGLSADEIAALISKLL